MKVADDCQRVNVELDATESAEYKREVLDSDIVIKEGTANGDFEFDTLGMELWCPENPKLYSFKIICDDHSLVRKFGVRRLLPDGPHFKLNGAPYFLRGVCEHCYFPDTIHPAHDFEYYGKT